MKTCSKCKESKPLSEFSKGSGRPCKECVKAYDTAHRNHIAVYQRRYQAANRDRIRIVHRQYRMEHSVELKIKGRKHYEVNCSRIAVIQHAYYTANRARVIARVQRYTAAHPAMNAASVRQWRAEHPEGHRAHQILKYAVDLGEVKKPAFCALCLASPETRHLHGHHPDYSKPLEVIWLCPACHSGIHRTGRIASGYIESIAPRAREGEQHVSNIS